MFIKIHCGNLTEQWRKKKKGDYEVTGCIDLVT